MRKLGLPLIALFMLFSLSACGGDEAQLEKLNGSWGVDIKASMSAENALEGLSPEEQKMALALAEGMLSSITIEFNTKENKMSFIMGEHMRSLDYTVESVDSKKVVLKTGNEIMNIEFKNDNSIVMAPEGDKTLVLIRK